MYYSKGDLYQGSTWEIIRYNKKGKPIYGHKPLDPGKYEASMAFHFGGGPKTPTVEQPASQTNATISSVGDGVRRPKKGKVKTKLSDLRINRPKAKIQTALGGDYSVGNRLNIGVG